MHENPEAPDPDYPEEYRPENVPGRAADDLFTTFHLWREAQESGNAGRAADLAAEAKAIIYGLDEQRFSPPVHLLRKYDFIRRLFLSGAYQNNPYLVAGPKFAVVPDENFPGNSFGQKTLDVPTVPFVSSAPADPSRAMTRISGPIGPVRRRRVLTPTSRALRAKIARRQKRSLRTGKFRNNPTPADWGSASRMSPPVHLPPASTCVPSGSVILREGSKEGASSATFAKYDPSWQVLTIRHTEQAGSRRASLEIEVSVYEDEAARMCRFVKAKGFSALLKALKRAKRPIRARRAFEESVKVRTGSSAPSGPPRTGMIPVPTPVSYPSLPPMRGEVQYVPHASKRSEDETIRLALSLGDHVVARAAEKDFEKAMSCLMALHRLLDETVAARMVVALHTVQVQLQRALDTVEYTWPGAIKRIK
jgi:hypothetical protein